MMCPVLASVDPGAIADTFGVRWPLLIAQMVNFCLVAYLLYRFALKPVMKTIDERQKAIADGLRYTEEMRAKLAQTASEREAALRQATQDAQKILHDAKSQSVQYLEQQKLEVKQQTDAMLQRTRVALEQEKRLMLHEVKKEVVELVVTTTGKILEDLPDPEKQRLNEKAAAALAKN